jgi:hypothetical protein
MSLRLFWMIALCSAGTALIASRVFAGQAGLEGMALGLFGTAFNLWALKAVIGLSTTHSASELGRRKGTFLIVLAFLMKLPVFIVLGLVAHRVGGPAPGCFLLGLALVYLALVGWSLAKR